MQCGGRGTNKNNSFLYFSWKQNEWESQKVCKNETERNKSMWIIKWALSYEDCTKQSWRLTNVRPSEFLIEIEFGIAVFIFVERIKPEITPRKTIGARTRTNNKLNPHMMPGQRIESGPHWWKTSALKTAPSLHPTHPPSKQVTFETLFFAVAVNV